MTSSLARIYTPQDRLSERDRLLSRVIGLTVSEVGLTNNDEQDLWQRVRLLGEQLLDRADAAVAARVALAAHSDRIDRHMKTHRECVIRQECGTYRSLVRQHCRLQREADRRFRDLVGGSR